MANVHGSTSSTRMSELSFVQRVLGTQTGCRRITGFGEKMGLHLNRIVFVRA